jgi:hypothetical protein
MLAKAGIQFLAKNQAWVPAYAGMTNQGNSS